MTLPEFLETLDEMVEATNHTLHSQTEIDLNGVPGEKTQALIISHFMESKKWKGQWESAEIVGRPVIKDEGLKNNSFLILKKAGIGDREKKDSFGITEWMNLIEAALQDEDLSAITVEVEIEGKMPDILDYDVKRLYKKKGWFSVTITRSYGDGTIVILKQYP